MFFQSEFVWMRGPIPAGEMNDKTMFCGGSMDTPKEDWDKGSLYNALPAGKKAVGDSIYEGVPEKVTVVRNGHSRQVKDFLNRILAREESAHGRLHSFRILSNAFRHNINKMAMHKSCAEACAVITQFNFRHHPLMEV